MRQRLLNRRTSSHSTFDWKKLVGVCCILLMLLGATAELTHSHDDGSHDSGRIHPDCSLCVVAHSAAQARVHTIAAVVLPQIARCADPEPIFVRRTLEIRLSTRPPPVTPVFA